MFFLGHQEAGRKALEELADYATPDVMELVAFGQSDGWFTCFCDLQGNEVAWVDPNGVSVLSDYEEAL